jgi:putative RecB family exonuclease
MTDRVRCEALGESVSPSQVNTYLSCPAKWYFRSLVGLSEPATGALALGKAFHQTLAANFRQKMNSKRDTDAAEARDVFHQAWASTSAEAKLRVDEDADELAATGEALVTAYVGEAARSIEPRAVELPVEGEVGGVKVRGTVDVVDEDGRVLDSRPPRSGPMASLQTTGCN